MKPEKDIDKLFKRGLEDPVDETVYHHSHADAAYEDHDQRQVALAECRFLFEIDACQ